MFGFLAAFGVWARRIEMRGKGQSPVILRFSKVDWVADLAARMALRKTSFND